MEDNIFYKIINKQIPSYSIYEDDLFIVILDAYPMSYGHTLVIPKEESKSYLYLQSNLAREINILGQKVALAIEKSLKASGFKIQFNVNKSGGQEIMWTHMHIIPFYSEEVKSPMKPDQELADLINKELSLIIK